MKTKYIILTALLLTFGAVNLHAKDPFQIGLQFGVNSSNYRFSGDGVNGTHDPAIGINAGLVFKIPISGGWGMTMGMGYGLTGYKIEIPEIIIPPEYDDWGNPISEGWYQEGGYDKKSFHNLSFDLNGYYKIPIWRDFSISPTLGWFMDARMNETSEESTPDGDINKYFGMRIIDTGPSAGVCVGIVSSLQIGFEYRLGVVGLMKPDFQAGIKQTSRTMNIYVRFLFGN